VSLLGIEYAAVLVFLFTLGSIFGSLLNVCIYRIPRHDSLWIALRGLVYPPSRCPSCFREILFRDNVPIFGWLKLRGRCRFCQARISARYPLIELLTGLLFVIMYWFEVPADPSAGVLGSSVWHQIGPQGDWASKWFSPVAVLHWRYALHTLLILALLVATFIDIDLRIIPDAVTVPGMTAGMLGGLLLGQVHLVPVWYVPPGVSMQSMLWQQFPTLLSLMPWLDYHGVPAWVQAHPHWHGLAVSLAGIVVGGGLVWMVRLVGFWVLKREAMGFGDVVLLAMIGSFIGWQGTLIVFFLAPLCALVVAVFVWLFWREREIPYGPYLSLATLVLLLGFKPIWSVMEQRVFSLGTFLPIVGGVMVVCLAGLLKLTRIVQRLFGYDPDADFDGFDAWGPGDQLMHLAGEVTRPDEGQWKISVWPGLLAGRGQIHDQQWRHGGNVSPINGWQSQWQRRTGN
jgi:leader peptidase (prepilin peptidase)/N-methyltransferase